MTPPISQNCAVISGSRFSRGSVYTIIAAPGLCRPRQLERCGASSRATRAFPPVLRRARRNTSRRDTLFGGSTARRRTRPRKSFQQLANSGSKPAAKVQPNHALALPMQRFEFPEGQRTLQLAEAVARAGNGNVAFLSGRQNQKNASRRAAFQELPKIVQIAGAQCRLRGNTDFSFDLGAQLGERGPHLDRGVQKAKNRHVAIRLPQIEKCAQGSG